MVLVLLPKEADLSQLISMYTMGCLVLKQETQALGRKKSSRLDLPWRERSESWDVDLRASVQLPPTAAGLWLALVLSLTRSGDGEVDCVSAEQDHAM